MVFPLKGAGMPVLPHHVVRELWDSTLAAVPEMRPESENTQNPEPLLSEIRFHIVNRDR